MIGIHTPEQLNELFATLADRVEEPFILGITGSAAMLYYGSELPAGGVIVDVFNGDESQLNQFEEAVHATAAVHKLPRGWLHYLNRGTPEAEFAKPAVFEDGANAVYVPVPEAMLSERIASGTPYGAERVESLALCKHLNVSTRDEIRTVYLDHTKDQSPGDELEEAVEQLADDLHTSRLRERSADQTQDAMQI